MEASRYDLIRRVRGPDGTGEGRSGCASHPTHCNCIFVAEVFRPPFFYKNLMEG